VRHAALRPLQRDSKRKNVIFPNSY
jgi:hypothetical protein